MNFIAFRSVLQRPSKQTNPSLSTDRITLYPDEGNGRWQKSVRLTRIFADFAVYFCVDVADADFAFYLYGIFRSSKWLILSVAIELIEFSFIDVRVVMGSEKI